MQSIFRASSQHVQGAQKHPPRHLIADSTRCNSTWSHKSRRLQDRLASRAAELLCWGPFGSLRFRTTRGLLWLCSPRLRNRTGARRRLHLPHRTRPLYIDCQLHQLFYDMCCEPAWHEQHNCSVQHPSECTRCSMPGGASSNDPKASRETCGWVSLTWKLHANIWRLIRAACTGIPCLPWVSEAMSC